MYIKFTFTFKLKQGLKDVHTNVVLHKNNCNTILQDYINSINKSDVFIRVYSH